jgi:hypothetical protein
MRQPISFIYRNVLFEDTGSGGGIWAAYRLATVSYPGLTEAAKREVLMRLAAFAYAIEADFTLLRVGRSWSVERYEMGVQATSDTRHAPREGLTQLLGIHREKLANRAVQVPEVYLSVRLKAERPVASELLRVPALARVADALGMGSRVAIGGKRLESILAEESKTFNRLLDYVDADRAFSNELQWLIRRAFCREVGEPDVDEQFRPQALIVEAPDDPAGVRFRPLEADLLRLFDAPINVHARSLRIESEFGDSHQAFLCLGALPEAVPFPSSRAELLFAPLEAVDFPVDAAFTARWLRNEDAVRFVRRRLVDADQIFTEEVNSDHGPSVRSADRPQTVRELEEYLTGGDRPPLLRATISLRVSAPTEQLLEERIERLRAEYGVVKLHRPVGEQLSLFIGHLPGKGSTLTDYDDYLTVEQFGGMVPIASHATGADVGPYIGHTLTGSQHPVLFDPAEAPRTSRAPATLLSGTLGSGKTLCMELIMYQAYLCGSTIVDVDPKGDHHLERLPGLAEHMEIIELSGDERFRGLLDPLRIGPDDTREDLAVDFLLSVLPGPVLGEWQTELRLAVSTVVGRGGRTCGEVIEELKRGGAAAAAAARALEIHAASGLARLGFADSETVPVEAEVKPITSLRIRNLTLPMPGTPRADLLEEERIGRAILHLLAVYALRLTTNDPGRHAVLGIDEAWVLLADGAGRSLVDRISRQGRALNVTPLLATQILGDVDDLEGLIGAAFCFGVESEGEARKSLRLLHLDEDDAELRSRLLGFRRGRCLMRDFADHVAPVQIDLVDPELLRALDTTPREQPVADDDRERVA